uniref:Uncharacterized protein n=1 Tax=Romanomermis culicivorax TaxID=13658 RepID=A0A915IR81_ROMCU
MRGEKKRFSYRDMLRDIEAALGLTDSPYKQEFFIKDEYDTEKKSRGITLSPHAFCSAIIEMIPFSTEYMQIRLLETWVQIPLLTSSTLLYPEWMVGDMYNRMGKTGRFNNTITAGLTITRFIDYTKMNVAFACKYNNNASVYCVRKTAACKYKRNDREKNQKLEITTIIKSCFASL